MSSKFPLDFELKKTTVTKNLFQTALSFPSSIPGSNQEEKKALKTLRYPDEAVQFSRKVMHLYHVQIHMVTNNRKLQLLDNLVVT